MFPCNSKGVFSTLQSEDTPLRFKFISPAPFPLHTRVYLIRAVPLGPISNAWGPACRASHRPVTQRGVNTDYSPLKHLPVNILNNTPAPADCRLRPDDGATLARRRRRRASVAPPSRPRFTLQIELKVKTSPTCRVDPALWQCRPGACHIGTPLSRDRHLDCIIIAVYLCLCAWRIVNWQT